MEPVGDFEWVQRGRVAGVALEPVGEFECVARPVRGCKRAVITRFDGWCAARRICRRDWCDPRSEVVGDGRECPWTMRGGPRPGEAGRWTNGKIEALERVGKIGCRWSAGICVGRWEVKMLNRICVGLACC